MSYTEKFIESTEKVLEEKLKECEEALEQSRLAMNSEATMEIQFTISALQQMRIQ